MVTSPTAPVDNVTCRMPRPNSYTKFVAITSMIPGALPYLGKSIEEGMSRASSIELFKEETRSEQPL